MLFLEPTMNAPHAMIGTTLTSKIIPPTVGKDDPLRIEVEEFRHIHAFGRYEKSDGREMDEYDIDATYLTVHEGDVLVGACRIVDKKTESCYPYRSDATLWTFPKGFQREKYRASVLPSILKTELVYGSYSTGQSLISR